MEDVEGFAAVSAICGISFESKVAVLATVGTFVRTDGAEERFCKPDGVPTES